MDAFNISSSLTALLVIRLGDFKMICFLFLNIVFLWKSLKLQAFIASYKSKINENN